jgi:hypothetical protein
LRVGTSSISGYKSSPPGSLGIDSLMLRVGRFPLLRWLFITLLVVSSGWLMPSTSRAGCSHYIRTKIQGASTAAIGLDTLDALAALPGVLPGTGFPIPPASPCSGLRCSQDQPVPASIPQVVPRIDLWGCLNLIAFTLQNPSSSVPFEDDCLHPTDRSEQLARPPW